jgi:hypothetical protein
MEEFMNPPLQDPERKVHPRVVLRIIEACRKVLECDGSWQIPDPRNPCFMAWCGAQSGSIASHDWNVAFLHKIVSQQSAAMNVVEQMFFEYVIQTLHLEEESYDPMLEARKEEIATARQAEIDLQAMPSDEVMEKVLKYDGSFAKQLKQAHAELLQLQMGRKAGRFDDESVNRGP